MDHVAFRLQLEETRSGFQWNCYTLDTRSDKYGRTLADMLLRMGTNVNHVLVKEGCCLGYRKYTLGNTS